MPPPNVQETRSTPANNEVAVPWRNVERFVGQLTHDIRNGLNACELQLTFLGEISPDPDSAEEIKGLRTTLAGITKQLQSVLVATGAVKAHSLDYPAADLFEDFKERFVRLQPEQAKRVAWNMATDHDALVSVDPELVLSSCLELLNNALHFADAGGNVVAEVSKADGGGLFTLEQPLNEAPTTPPDDWGKVPLQSTRRGAYGLGLFRVRRALSAQGASLGFRYDADRRALLTIVTLPLVSASPVL